MKRILLAGLILTATLVTVFATVNIRSDAAAIFGPGGAELDSLDTSAGRDLIIALEGAADRRNAAARDLATLLRADPSVAEVRSGPSEPSQPFVDWLWLHRLQLAPADTDADAMTANLNNARATLASAEGMILGDRFLRDPTGSFARLIERLTAQSARLAQRDGIWQSKDDRAALLFVTLSDQPFETDETAALSGLIRAEAKAAGVTPYLLGPRVIAAEISTETARSSTRSAGLASLLLIGWLIYSLRSLRSIALAVLPLALGFGVATLAVQSVFGSVHVIALGFGGVLTGLALDYPIHLLGHSNASRDHARRLILIGATTTAIGFFAMVGSGVPALMQTGVFVASGLLVAALSARLLIGGQTVAMHTPPLERLTWYLPCRRCVESALAVIGLLIVLSAGASSPKALFSPPESVVAGIERMREMIDLPSGRYVVRIEGDNLAELLSKQASLATDLDAAIEMGALDGYTMLGQIFEGGSSEFPSAEAFSQQAGDALTAAGMAPAFAKAQTVAFREAVATPAIALSDFDAFGEARALTSRLEVTEGRLQENVRLIGLKDPRALTIRSPGATLVNTAAPIEVGLTTLRQQVILWLAVGAVGAVICLAVGLRNWRLVSQIALTSAAAMGATVGLLTLVSGALGIFQIVAMTLVIGIGIDYGLFLRTATEGEGRAAAARSVSLCAGSTLIAFTVMAFSSVNLLHEIGLTVSLGVIVMLVLNLAQSHQNSAHADMT